MYINLWGLYNQSLLPSKTYAAILVDANKQKL